MYDPLFQIITGRFSPLQQSKCKYKPRISPFDQTRHNHLLDSVLITFHKNKTQK